MAGFRMVLITSTGLGQVVVLQVLEQGLQLITPMEHVKVNRTVSHATTGTPEGRGGRVGALPLSALVAFLSFILHGLA